MNVVRLFLFCLLVTGCPALLTAQDHQDHFAQDAVIDTNAGLVTAFELQDSKGDLVTLNDYSGKYVLLTFGFTQCAHICPMIAANMSRVLKKSSTDNRVGIFVSVDTERDTPIITHQYASGFHKDMIGLSGTYEQVNQAAKNFRVSYSVSKTQQHYTVQHTTSIYLINPHGKLVESYAMNTPVDTISSAIK